MSRIAKNPVAVPSGVEVKLNADRLSVKGPKGNLECSVHPYVKVNQEGGLLKFERTNDSRLARAVSGTTRALVNNMVQGVAKGFEKKLTIVGVGYRVAMQGKKLNLTLGYSHPIAYDIPAGIAIECPDQTHIVIKGADKQRVGQVAAEIRGFRPPEPYKGKGIRYRDEQVRRKVGKRA